MEDPVMCRCCHTFEREAIVSWMARGNPCCPISRKDLAWEDLVPNHILAERIEKWRWQKEHEDWLHQEKTPTTSPGSRTVLSGNDDRAAKQDNVDESELDLEMETIHSLPAPKKQLYAASQIYQAVPTGLMLLPQEQALQDSIRNRKEENRRKRRQACICSTVLTLCLGLAIVAAGLYIVQFLQQKKSDDDLDDGPV
jgi:hypothetical protein